MNFKITGNHSPIWSLYQNSAFRKSKSYLRKNLSASRDDVSISSAGRELATTGKVPSININRMVDKTIDLSAFIEKAKKKNEEALEKVGTEIRDALIGFETLDDVLRAALQEKYSKLVADAKAQPDPEEYISEKYSRYRREGLLSEREAAAGWRYEMQILKNGEIGGWSTDDSLFRGVHFDWAAARRDESQLQRRIVNKQMENIFAQAGISKEQIGDNSSFTVNPYSYQITVQGVEESVKAQMEKALNVGTNGKFLYFHISKMASREGANSIQLSEEGRMKYQTYHDVVRYSGYKLDELEQRGDSFYTQDHKDIKTLVAEGMQQDGMIPPMIKDEYIHRKLEAITKLARIGWKNVVDMPLKILYGKNGLRDYGQSILFDGISNLNGKHWHSLM